MNIKNVMFCALCLFSLHNASAYAGAKIKTTNVAVESKNGNGLDYLNPYNVVWTSQSKNCFESMPLGGGDVGLNVWVEKGELMCYLSQSGTFDENNQMLKEGRVRIKLTPNPFDNPDNFKQELVLKDGNIVVTAQKGAQKISINLWVDVFKPIIHIDATGNTPVNIDAAYETWRTKDLDVPPAMRHSSFSYSGFPGDVVTYKDNISAEDNEVMWYHRNKSDKLLYDYCIKQQGLEKYRDRIVNTQKNRTCGGMMWGDDFIYSGTTQGKYISTGFTAWHLKSKKSVISSSLKVLLHTNICNTMDEWVKEVRNLVSKTKKGDAGDKKKTIEWWHNFWRRSYISINGDYVNRNDSAWQVGRNYQLFRYMQGCNAYGDYPTKFNGSLFTVDPVFTKHQFDWTPDFRQWGGGSFTAQNQRLVYWPMIKNGDFDMMPSQFNYYKRALSSAEARTECYWGHEGASFTEQLENFGLPFAGGWGFGSGERKRDPKTEWGEQTNKCVCHHYVNQLEFSFMILEYYRYSGIDIKEYLPFIKSSIKFFDEHYRYENKKLTGKELDDNGKLVLFPSTAAEMYKIAKNPADVIAAMKTVVERMTELPEKYVSKSEKEYYENYLKRIPDIPFDIKQGHKVIKPAEKWGYVSNMEIPELYTVFPYSIYGLNKPGLDIARNTYWYGESNKKKSFVVCWSQVGIFASRLGLTDEASRLVKIKLSNASNRFPAFWGPGPDWIPDVDHGGAGMINLQEMLMQTTDSKIYLLPTWPENWNVKFKLHAPNRTIVEAEVKGGKLVSLDVTPKSRMKDVVVAEKFK